MVLATFVLHVYETFRWQGLIAEYLYFNFTRNVKIQILGVSVYKFKRQETI